MDFVWKLVNKRNNSETGVDAFLLLNTIIWSVVGLLFWLIVRNFGLKTIDWAICFVGCFGYMIGFLGGVFYLWRRK